MAELTQNQLLFLKSVGVNESETLDATGMKRKEYEKIVEENDLKIAYGLSPCTNGGHTLKTRSGHCVVCRPLDLNFQNKHNEGGYVYIAYSKELAYIKIGIASNICNRQKSLRNQKYGGFGDWVISQYIKVAQDAGVVEASVKHKLAEYKVLGTYKKDGKDQVAVEMFRYTVEQARRDLKEIVAELNL